MAERIAEGGIDLRELAPEVAIVADKQDMCYEPTCALSRQFLRRHIHPHVVDEIPRF